MSHSLWIACTRIVQVVASRFTCQGSPSVGGWGVAPVQGAVTQVCALLRSPTPTKGLVTGADSAEVTVLLLLCTGRSFRPRWVTLDPLQRKRCCDAWGSAGRVSLSLQLPGGGARNRCRVPAANTHPSQLLHTRHDVQPGTRTLPLLSNPPPLLPIPFPPPQAADSHHRLMLLHLLGPWPAAAQ